MSQASIGTLTNSSVGTATEATGEGGGGATTGASSGEGGEVDTGAVTMRSEKPLFSMLAMSNAQKPASPQAA